MFGKLATVTRFYFEEPKSEVAFHKVRLLKEARHSLVNGSILNYKALFEAVPVEKMSCNKLVV